MSRVKPLLFVPFHCIPHHVKSNGTKRSSLDELLEGAVDGRADFGALVEIDCGYGTLADAFRGEFEFLIIWLAYWKLDVGKQEVLTL